MANVQTATVRNIARHRYLVYLILWLCICFPGNVSILSLFFNLLLYNLSVAALYFKISERPVPDRKTVNVSDDIPNKYGNVVNKIDYEELTRVCNPLQTIECGDEGNIGKSII